MICDDLIQLSQALWSFLPNRVSLAGTPARSCDMLGIHHLLKSTLDGWWEDMTQPLNIKFYCASKCLKFLFNSGIHESFVADLVTKGTTLGATGAVGLAAIASSTRGRRGPFLWGWVVSFLLSLYSCTIIIIMK